MKKASKEPLTIVAGNNFSGKSDFLKKIITNTKKGIYIGEQPSNYLSGVMSTVEGEIKLHTISKKSITTSLISELFSEYEFDKHLHKNPFTLSGGEQVILSVLCTVLLQPSKVAIDTTIEQLNKYWREPLFNLIQQKEILDINFFLADNRFKEYGLSKYNLISPSIEKEECKNSFETPLLQNNIESFIDPVEITLSNLSFYYNKSQPILNNSNLQLQPGIIYHLKGNNGAGKSTLAKILTGALKAKSGYIQIQSKKYNPFKYPGKIVGYSFQNPDEQLFMRTVEKEMFVQSDNQVKNIQKRKELYLKMFGLSNLKEKHPAELPFAIRKRIALASTLVLDRPWYILDEPTLGQDDDFVSFLCELLLKLKQIGKGIIIISHSERFTEKVSEKTLYLHNQSLTF